jgi:hypothetical protein
MGCIVIELDNGITVVVVVVIVVVAGCGSILGICMYTIR